MDGRGVRSLKASVLHPATMLAWERGPIGPLVAVALAAGCAADDGAASGTGPTSSTGVLATTSGTGATAGVESESGVDLGGGSGSETGSLPSEPMAISAEPWRLGDATVGWDVLLYGSNTGSGVPLELFATLPGPPVDNVFDRTGVSADIPWFYNASEAPNGVMVTAPACLSCHGSRASALGNEVVVGLGNVFEGGRIPSMGEMGFVGAQVDATYGEDSDEAIAFTPFFTGMLAIIGHSEPPIPGTNSAFFIEEAGMAHRAPATQAWLSRPRFAKASEVLASDIPPWWHLKKKHALYYNGMGRGDAARLLMQSSVVASFGLDHLIDVDAQMPDLLAYLLTVEAPPFPDPVDASLVAEGEATFAANCVECHGTYGEDETYPNLLVPLQTVGTDPAYAEYFMQPGRLVDAYNDGWFGTGDPASRLQPEAGYVAPPLDGVWLTAPYFHNGSVPSLAAVLDSSIRPVAWLRDFEEHGYSLDVPGLAFEAVEPGVPSAYDTTQPGYGNGGHTFGDGLSATERVAVIEYLKTL